MNLAKQLRRRIIRALCSEGTPSRAESGSYLSTPRDAARLLFHELHSRARSLAASTRERLVRSGAPFARGSLSRRTFDSGTRTTINIDEERGFSLSLRRNRLGRNRVGAPLKGEPTSVEGFARAEAGDVYGYKDDSGGCDVKTRMDAHNDVNPFVPERLHRCDVSERTSIPLV